MTLRRPLAILVAVAALVPLGLIRFAASDSISGGGSIGGGTDYEYTLGELTASMAAVSVVLAVMVAVAAAGLWAARDRRLLVLTVAVGVAGAIATIVVAGRQSGTDPVSPAEMRAVPPGIDRDELEDRLGRPAGSGTATSPRGDFECAVYNGVEPGAQPMFCFEGDRLALKVNR
jgi:hypothetical protein